MHTSLTHVDGRSMDVVIVSRSQTQVHFQRQSDGSRLSCRIADLDLWSKGKVLWNFTPSSGVTPSADSASSPLRDLHLSGMQEILVDLQEELSLQRLRFNAAETNTQRRTTLNDIEATELKIRKVELKRAEHLSHLKR